MFIDSVVLAIQLADQEPLTGETNGARAYAAYVESAYHTPRPMLFAQLVQVDVPMFAAAWEARQKGRHLLPTEGLLILADYARTDGEAETLRRAAQGHGESMLAVERWRDEGVLEPLRPWQS